MAPLDIIGERNISHINYNHLYYFWYVYKEGSVVDTAEALFLTPQTITGWTKALEERLQGKLFKRKGRGLEPSELGELVFHCADCMLTPSQEMPDIVNYRKESNLLSDVGVAGALSRRLASGVLDTAVVESEQIRLCCFESTHELLLEQLSQRKFDMIISDYPIDSTQQEGSFSMKTGECGVSFWCMNPVPTKPFPACLEEWRPLIPGRRPTLGHKLLNWINVQSPKAEILGEFGDAALMKTSGAVYNAISVASTFYVYDFYYDESIIEIGRIDSVMEEYYAIFTERMIQYLAVQRICNRDYLSLLTESRQSAGVGWRDAGRASARQRGKTASIKKPVPAGFFNRVQ